MGVHLLRFERLLSNVSSALIAASPAETEVKIEEALRAVTEFFGVDRTTLAEISRDGRNFSNRSSYGRPGVPIVIPLNTPIAETAPWSTQEQTRGRVVCFGRTPEPPPEALPEWEVLQQGGLRALLSVPVLMHGQWRYVLAISSFTEAVDWPDDLIPRVRLLAEMLAHAHEHARADRVRDDFIAIASHELRTPCTSMQLAVQALSRKDAGKAEATSDPVRRFLGTIERQVANLNLLVDRLLDASLIAEGQLQLEPSEVDLADITRAAVGQLAEPLRVSGSGLTVDAEPVIGHWDRVRLEQVAMNLIANAIKFGRGAPIEVVVRAEGSTATLAVRDRGIEIPLAEQARIFDRFARAVSSRHFGGFGLGLYISKAIVDAHGGSIEVTSRPEEGSTFVVRLPLASENVP
jgi:signal transduction histidine kinase